MITVTIALGPNGFLTREGQSIVSPKVESIKTVRRLSGSGLKEAKDFVEYLQAHVGHARTLDFDDASRPIDVLRECIRVLRGCGFIVTIESDAIHVTIESDAIQLTYFVHQALDVAVNIRDFETARKLISVLEGLPERVL